MLPTLQAARASARVRAGESSQVLHALCPDESLLRRLSLTPIARGLERPYGRR